MRTIAICLLPLLLSACGDKGSEDLKQWMANSSLGLRGQIEPLPQVQTYKPFNYQAYDLTDPFNPQKLQAGKQQNAANAPDLKRPREALENYDLDKLAMVGTIRRGGAVYALIRTPEGRSTGCSRAITWASTSARSPRSAMRRCSLPKPSKT
ncbi:Pilus assembly protein, PilP [Chromobacterium violaceum]|uniref:Pilus assembly protein, PilP n=1 Tax=Chromobacterium violaceum TaxID=536 RepID=A0A3S4HNA2_CHRVL|nr:Pilus assembly protein, PilP [Chromobacterium violaceum]